MITIVTVWLCLITHVACDVVITVNNNGSDNGTCCVNGTCPCSSLSSALHNMSDNTVINITSESVTLHDIVGMGSGNLNNIIITGNGATIMCNNTGGVYCESCSDITIMGITWYQCGHNDPFRALTFVSSSSNIFIQDCTFQNCSVYIWSAKGKVIVSKSNFIADLFHLPCNYSGLYISYDAYTVIAINNSKFDGTCNGVSIEPSNNITGFNRFLFKNTNFSNNYCGLDLSTQSSGEKEIIELFNVNAYNNKFGVSMHMNGASTYTSFSGTVIISSAAFVNNYLSGLVVRSFDTVNISSATFINNSQASTTIIATTVSISSTTFVLGFDYLTARTVNVSSVTFISNPLIIEVDSDGLSIEISNSIFYNNSDAAITIKINSRTECPKTSIVFTNVIIYKIGNTFGNPGDVLYISNENTILSALFKNVSLISNNLTHVLYIHNKEVVECNQRVSIQFTGCTFDGNFALDHMVALNIIADENIHHVYQVTIELHDCNFDNNFGGDSIVYVNVPSTGSMILAIENSTFSNNKGTVLHLIITELLFQGNSLFINNSATNGAAVYMEEVYTVSFDDNATVRFINNSVDQKGGAMYINIVILETDSDRYCNVFNSISNTSNVSFINNSASIAGNSIYFSVPKSCHIITDINNKSSLLYVPNMFRYFKPVFTNTSPIVTSPHNIKLYPPAIIVDNSENNYFMQQSKMLGEPIQIVASVLDYFNNVTEPVVFSIKCETCGDEYVLSTYLITVHSQSTYELKIFCTVGNDVINNINISMTFLSTLSQIHKQIDASLLIALSSCRAGYVFDSTQGQCVCYPYPDLVHCKEDYVEIKIGYWIGYLTEQHYTTSICPDNYCSSEHTETSPGYYSLHGESDDQCSSHRTGVACGECKSGYTLAYDSPDCINIDKCSPGMTILMTILVIMLTVLYWIAVVTFAFGLMYFQFQISSGYAYGIIYFYSIVDILLVNNVSEKVHYLVSILSSFAKLTPQLFGQVCFVKGLSGIDQQFIHYSHALGVSVILLIIVLVTKYSPRLTQLVGRCIIRVICLLLLLSYTSLASTSLQLLRPLIFKDVDEVRTYSSPDIKYFTGRHLVYAIVAILCEVIIVIGLPLFLLLEPVLRRRVNLVRIKPLLDQFQGCYKDKYRWFAAYYLICRQVIILIVYVGNGNYYYMLYGLQTACVIIAMIHGCVHPYKSNLLNVLDEVILVILVLVVNLNLFSLSSIIPTNYFSVALVILPLLVICFIAIRKLISYFFVRKKRELQLYNPVGTHEGNDRNNERR